MQGTWVQSPGWEDPLEKEIITHSSILTWKIPWIEEPGWLQSTGLRKRVRHDLLTKQQLVTNSLFSISVIQLLFFVIFISFLGVTCNIILCLSLSGLLHLTSDQIRSDQSLSHV